MSKSIIQTPAPSCMSYHTSSTRRTPLVKASQTPDLANRTSSSSASALRRVQETPATPVGQDPPAAGRSPGGKLVSHLDFAKIGRKERIVKRVLLRLMRVRSNLVHLKGPTLSTSCFRSGSPMGSNYVLRRWIGWIFAV